MEWETEFPSQILSVDFQFPTLNEGAPSTVLDSPSDPCEFPAQKFLCPKLPLTSWQSPDHGTPLVGTWNSEISHSQKNSLSSQTWLPSPPIIFTGILPPHLHNSISSWAISTLSCNGNGSCCLFLTCWNHLKMPVQIVLALVPLLPVPPIPPYPSWEQNFNQIFNPLSNSDSLHSQGVF